MLLHFYLPHDHLMIKYSIIFTITIISTIIVISIIFTFYQVLLLKLSDIKIYVLKELYKVNSIKCARTILNFYSRARFKKLFLQKDRQ